MVPGRRPPGHILSVTFPPRGGAVVIGGASYAIKRCGRWRPASSRPP